MRTQVWEKPAVIDWIQLLLDSYEKLLGYPLIEHGGEGREVSKTLFFAPFVLVSHGTQADPIFNYGNQTALSLWEMTWDELTRTPSRLTAEPPNQQEREELLKQVTEQGFVKNYQGIRISKTGKRFRIEDVTVWNIFTREGIYRGQAATYRHWSYL